jgi:hypothetical protein
MEIKGSKVVLRGVTTATVSIYANAPVAPGPCSVTKVSSTGYEGCVSVGVPTAFSGDTSNPPYDYKSMFSITASSVNWPVGENQTVLLRVNNVDGIQIGVVSVLLEADTSYLVTPDACYLSLGVVE